MSLVPLPFWKENIMNREAREKAIDTGYYKGTDLDAESYVPVSFENAGRRTAPTFAESRMPTWTTMLKAMK